ncbi:MAG: hypothetical protein ACEQSR_08470 [Candidatus Methylacidiphilales bacterium]
MKLTTAIFTSLLAFNGLLAQNSDLFYKKTETKQAPNNNVGNTSQSVSVKAGQKPFQINIGDARSWIGASYRLNLSKDLSFGPGIHFGKMSFYNGNESLTMINFSALFRYRPNQAYLKFGPYLNLPIASNSADFEEVIVLPGLGIGGGYEFKNGFDIGLVQHLDVFFLSEVIEGIYNPLWMLPSISLSYHFGEPKLTKIAKSSSNKSPNPNYNLVPIEVNTPPQETIPKVDYSNYSDEGLKKLLDQATAAEKYSEANDIQAEITKRTEQNKYAKLSTEELKKQLEAALKAEDYTKAETLQKEIDKRAGQKKDKTPDNSTKQPAKKSLKNLEEDLKKAMDAEDYKKADEIQKEINKLKKP